MRWLKCRNKKSKSSFLCYYCKVPVIYHCWRASSPKPKASFVASSLSILLTWRLKKLACGEYVPPFPHKSRKEKKKKKHSCWMLQCTSLHQAGTLTEWDIVYFWAMKLQAGKPKAVARCDWCNQGLLGQTRRRAPEFPLVNHGTGL